MVRDPLAWRFTKVYEGMQVYVRTHAPIINYLYLWDGWTDCAETSCVVREPLAMRFTQNGDILMSARVTVSTFKHIYLLPLVHRPMGLTGHAVK